MGKTHVGVGKSYTYMVCVGASNSNGQKILSGDEGLLKTRDLFVFFPTHFPSCRERESSSEMVLFSEEAYIMMEGWAPLVAYPRAGTKPRRYHLQDIVESKAILLREELSITK